MLKRFFYGSASILMLAALYHPGSSTASAQTQPPVLQSSWPSTGLPLGLALDNTGRVYMAEEADWGLALRVFDLGGNPLAVFSTGGGIEGYGVVLTRDGSVLLADYYGCKVLRFGPDGSLLASWPTGGLRALFLALDESDNVFVTDDEGGAVRKFSSQGALLAQWSSPHPAGIAFRGGYVYVAGMFNGIMSIYTPDGTAVTAFPTGCSMAEQLQFDALGLLYLTDHAAHQLKCFQTDGTRLWTIGPDLGQSQFTNVDFFSVAIRSDGLILAGDYAGRRVLVFGSPATPTIRSSWGSLKAKHRK
jgi:sugar lactone lactonase YvrE